MRVQVIRKDGAFEDLDAPVSTDYDTVNLDLTAIPPLHDGDTLALLPTEDEAALLGWLTDAQPPPSTDKPENPDD